MQTITFMPGVKYGVGCVKTATAMRMHTIGLRPSPLFDTNGKTLVDWTEGSERLTHSSDAPAPRA